MKITTQRLTCKCGRVFESEIVTDAPLVVSVASLRAIRCPTCGSYGAYLGGSLGDPPPLSCSVMERASWWIDRGETGSSSLTIYAAFTGSAIDDDEADFPFDPDDFRRCKLLLDLIPEWRSDLQKVADRFPWLAPFVKRWDRFDRLYAQESESTSCPKLYAALQSACKEAEKLRYGQE